MPVDVTTHIVIGRPRDEVAAYAADPGRAPEWYANIESVQLLSDPPLRVGTTMIFVARFLGRRLEYTYEVVTFEPSRQLVMRTAEGPFPMETTYTWTDDTGGTAMSLRNRGEPTGFAKFGAAAMTAAMRRANRKDLDRLKAILEAGTSS